MDRLRKLLNSHQKTDPYWTSFLENNGYPREMIESTALKLEKMPEDLQNAVKKWDATGILPAISAEGFGIQELVAYMGVHEIAAFLMIDWLRREPEAAKAALAEPVSKISVDGGCVEEMILAEEADNEDV